MPILFEDDNYILCNYSEAMKRPDLWQKPMEAEMNVMKEEQV